MENIKICVLRVSAVPYCQPIAEKDIATSQGYKIVPGAGSPCTEVYLGLPAQVAKAAGLGTL